MEIRYRLVFLTGLICLGAVCSACVNPLGIDEKSFSSHYEYQLSIGVDVPVHNLTLTIPLPTRNGVPGIGNLNLSPEIFMDPRYLLRPLVPGSGFRCSEEVVNGLPFLTIKADTMDPGQEYHFEYVENIDLPPYVYRVNTRYPIGNESVFFPKYNLSEYSTVPAHITYQTAIYADYAMGGSGQGQISIVNRVSGSNYWRLTSEASVGNHYTDSMYIDLYHKSPGWQMVQGSMAIGTGTYLK